MQARLVKTVALAFWVNPKIVKIQWWLMMFGWVKHMQVPHLETGKATWTWAALSFVLSKSAKNWLDMTMSSFK